MALSLRTRVGPYEIVGELGVGGMGEVYRARDTRLNREVALKVLPWMFAVDPDRKARFDREAQVLGSLNHPNIAALYGFEDSGSTRALVMELVEGVTLAKRIGAGRIPIEEVLAIAKQIADALEYAHDRTIIHRDLKPANIKVTPDGTVKVLDFGLAKALETQPASADPCASPTITMDFSSTGPGVILGTAAYMSPEQAKGRAADRRSDVWSFGVVMFEMLSGKRLFEGGTPVETIAEVMNKTPAIESLPARTPASIRNLIRRCLEKDPRRRLQHIGEARIALDNVLSGVLREETAPSSRPTIFRRVLGVAAFLLVAALGTVAFKHLREVPAQQTSIRFDVLPPGKSLAAMFKLSPDGRQLAIVAFGGGQNRLWIRPLDLIEAHTVPGTEDARYPFWSPDSAFVAFFAQGKLKRVATAGGPPQTLCDAPDGRGGAWNSEGVILFAPAISGGLYSVPAQGGVPTAVTKVDASSTLNSHRFPEFLPRSRHFTYVAQSDKPEANGIYVGSLDGKPSAHLLPDISPGAYVAPAIPGRTGHLVFLRESMLMARPFDPVGLQATGEIFPLAERVGVAGDTGSAAFSVSDNGILAFRSGGSVGNRELVWMDRRGKRLDVLTKPDAISSAALSSDEKTLAFTVGQPGAANIWLQNLTSGTLSQFTLRSGSNRAAVWSPDGRRVVFASTQPSISDLFQKPVNGGKEELLVHAGVGATAYDWSPDGKFVVYSQHGAKTNDDLWLLPTNGDRKPVPYLLDPFNEVLGSFSPNGRWMAYVSDESGPLQVYVQTIPAGSGKSQVSTAGGSQPRWRRDGKELYYVAPDQTLMAVPVNSGAGASGPFEVGAPQTLFGGIPFNGLLSQAFFYQPSADGQRFMVTNLSGGESAAGPPITVVVNWQAGLRR